MIDIPAVLRRGILLCNTPGANSVAVAEHTFALLLGYLRNVPQCDNAVRTGQWERPGPWAVKSAARPWASSASAT